MIYFLPIIKKKQHKVNANRILNKLLLVHAFDTYDNNSPTHIVLM